MFLAFSLYRLKCFTFFQKLRNLHYVDINASLTALTDYEVGFYAWFGCCEGGSIVWNMWWNCVFKRRKSGWRSLYTVFEARSRQMKFTTKKFSVRHLRKSDEQTVDHLGMSGGSLVCWKKTDTTSCRFDFPRNVVHIFRSTSIWRSSSSVNDER